MGLSDTPDGPACPSRASGWRHASSAAGASRVAFDLLCRHAVAITPAGPQAGSVARPCACDGGLPHPIAGSAPTSTVFEACSAFTRVTACLLAESPKRPFPSEASAVSLPPLPLRLLPAGATPCRAGIAPTEDQRLFTAHNGVSSFFPPLAGLEAAAASAHRAGEPCQSAVVSAGWERWNYRQSQRAKKKRSDTNYYVKDHLDLGRGALLGRPRRLGLMVKSTQAAKQWQSPMWVQGIMTVKLHCHCLAACARCASLQNRQRRPSSATLSRWRALLGRL